MDPGDSQHSAADLRASYLRAGRMLLVLAAFHVGHITWIVSMAVGRGTFGVADGVIGFGLNIVFLTFVIWVAVGVRRGRRIMAGTCVAVFFLLGWLISMATAVANEAPFTAWLAAFEIAYFCVALLATIAMVTTHFRHEGTSPPSSVA